MTNKPKTILGTLKLPEIERAIRFEEVKSFEFLSSNINGKDNLAKFKRLELGNIPNELKLTFDGDAEPNNYVPLANNPISMIVDGSEKKVRAWRTK